MSKTNPTFLMLSFVISLILLIPLIYALSKTIWANMFVNYDENAVTNFQISLHDGSGT